MSWYLLISLTISSIHEENYIDSDCKFDTLRIQKQNVLCNDYGYYKKYCKHYALPDEFIVKQERGLDYKPTYNIKPSKMYKETNDNKVVIADFYYTFKCDKLDNEPRLYLRIIPTNDNITQNGFIEFIVCAIILVFIVILVIICYPELSNVSDFSSGFILGSLSSNSSNKKIYCD